MDVFTGVVTDSDILIENGIVVKIAQDIKAGRDVEIIDVENAYISTGWIEAHTHISWFGNECSLVPEMTYPADGITYVNDAGTEGPLNYAHVHEMMQTLSIKSSSYLYVALEGTNPAGGELKSLDYLDEDKFKEVYEAYKDEIIGVKIRIDARVNYDILESLKRAKRLARELSLPLIIHPTRCTESLINKVTVAPANMLGLKDKSLVIKEGDMADITAFRIEDGDFLFSDSYGNIVHSKQRVSNVVTIYGENVFLPRKAIFLK